MKTILLILFSFTFSICYSQSDISLLKCKELPKGANIITLKTIDSINVAFKKIANIILDYGFTIANSDKDLYFLNTDFVSFGGYTFKTKLNVRVKENEGGGTAIILKGEAINFYVSITPANYHRKDVPNRAFAHMLSIALKYEDSAISTSSEN